MAPLEHQDALIGARLWRRDVDQAVDVEASVLIGEVIITSLPETSAFELTRNSPWLNTSGKAADRQLVMAKSPADRLVADSISEVQLTGWPSLRHVVEISTSIGRPQQARPIDFRAGVQIPPSCLRSSPVDCAVVSRCRLIISLLSAPI